MAEQSGAWRALPRRMPLADDTYEILRDALVNNKLAPGQRLNIEQLAQDLNVSITPIRHALVRLEYDGFVVREPYKGYVASELLDRATVAEIFEARMIIEPELVSKATERATKEDIAFLTRVAKMDPTARVTDEDAGVVGDPSLIYDGALHRRIALIAGNRTLIDMVDRLDKRMSAYLSFKNRSTTDSAELQAAAQDRATTKREHAAIVKAIKDGDAEAARKAVRRHLENAFERDVHHRQGGESPHA